MKKYSLVFSLLLLALTASATSYPFKPIHAPRELSFALDILSRLPEARLLIAEVQKEGNVLLDYRSLSSDHISAVWVGDERRIILNADQSWTTGKKISSILYELHNAKRNRELSWLNQLARRGAFSRRSYVLAVEKLEYDNALQTGRLLTLGISRGLFPADAAYSVHPDFSSHLRLQQDKGHSAFIAQTYDMLQRSRYYY